MKPADYSNTSELGKVLYTDYVFAFEVAADFSTFYEACHILSEEDSARQASWLQLSATTLSMLSVLLDLLGIEVPERM